MKSKKKEIKVDISGILYFSLDNLGGSLEKAIKNLQEIPEKYKQAYEERVKADGLEESYKTNFHPDNMIRYEIQTNYDYYEENIKLYGVRLETDEECKRRLSIARATRKRKKELEEKKKQEVLEQEKILYEKLKKKFGPKK